MSTDPVVNPDPEQQPTSLAEAPVIVTSPDPAARYIAVELQKTRLALRNTQIFGLLIVLLVGGELLYITSRFHQSLQPHAAAEIADGIIMQQVNDRGPEVADQIKQKIPEYIEQTPDYVKEQLPRYRESMEERVETTLTHYCDTTSQQLGSRINGYLDTHKDQIKGMLAAPNDPQTMQQAGQDLRKELMAYLSEKPAQGEAIKDQIDQSLTSLQSFEARLHHLASGSHLTPQEEKTRQVIAVLTRSIDDQKLDQKAQSLASDAKGAVNSTGQ